MQFQQADGVAVDGEGNILVADSYSHRIQKFTAEGQFLTAVGTKGNGPLQFDQPTGMLKCMWSNWVIINVIY